MIHVGITGHDGFVGSHLCNYIRLQPDKFTLIDFDISYFEKDSNFEEFVSKCDVIVHLAAMNRHDDAEVLYNTNIGLVQKLIHTMEKVGVRPHVLFSSSTQEENDSLYGKSKMEGRKLLEAWAQRSGANFTGLVIPNVFGEFSRPNYNTFIATFASKLIAGETPEIISDNTVSLIHISSLCRWIMECFDLQGVNRVVVPFDFERKVSEVLEQLKSFHATYYKNGFIPKLETKHDVNLFNTFRSYIDYAKHFPVKLTQHADERGVFVETIRLGVGGQVSFSTTLPGITRGNHYHTRKIERFTVIKGKARIQLRKVGSDEVINLFLDGNEPAYVDMPVWFTHNISNVGDDELYTQFWINEWYDPNDADTYFEEV